MVVPTHRLFQNNTRSLTQTGKGDSTMHWLRPIFRALFPRINLTLDQIVDETRQLPPEVRTELVERLILAGHGGIEPEIDEPWKQISRQRIAKIHNGQAKDIPVDGALAEIRKLAGL